MVWSFICVLEFTCGSGALASQSYQEQNAPGLWSAGNDNRLIYIDEALRFYLCRRKPNPTVITCEGRFWPSVLSYNAQRDRLKTQKLFLTRRFKIDSTQPGVAFSRGSLFAAKIYRRSQERVQIIR